MYNELQQHNEIAESGECRNHRGRPNKATFTVTLWALTTRKAPVLEHGVINSPSKQKIGPESEDCPFKIAFEITVLKHKSSFKIFTLIGPST